MNAFEWLRAYLLVRVPLDIAAEAAGLSLSTAKAERRRLQLKGEFGGEEQAAAVARLEESDEKALKTRAFA
jgi:hypothetical protein